MAMNMEAVAGSKFLEEAWFVQDADGIALAGSRCEACGKVFFPIKQVCPNCFDGELKTVALSRKGKLHSYALSVMGLPDLEKPYMVAWIDLPEGIKVFSLISDCEPFDKVLSIGMEMEMVTGKIRLDEDGNEIIAYKFRPVR
jgi:uncharacterized OB-fold protein